MDMNIVEDLARELTTWKAAENEAIKERTRIELALAALISKKLEGTDSVEVGFYKITVSNKLNRTLDFTAYQAVETSIPFGLRCVDFKPTLNLKKMRALEMADPNIVPRFVTVKPAKVAVKVEEI